MEEAHTQMTTQQLDTMLAEAHRRGALEAIGEAIMLLGSNSPRGILIERVLRGIASRYEEKTEK